jgi:hypothetical protein
LEDDTNPSSPPIVVVDASIQDRPEAAIEQAIESDEVEVEVKPSSAQVAVVDPNLQDSEVDVAAGMTIVDADTVDVYLSKAVKEKEARAQGEDNPPSVVGRNNLVDSSDEEDEVNHGVYVLEEYLLKEYIKDLNVYYSAYVVSGDEPVPRKRPSRPMGPEEDMNKLKAKREYMYHPGLDDTNNHVCNWYSPSWAHPNYCVNNWYRSNR